VKKKIIIIGAIIIGTLMLLVGGFFVYLKLSESKFAQQNANGGVEAEGRTVEKKKSNGLPKLMNIGMNIEPYNAATGMAGDIKFEKLTSRHWRSMMFEHFGYKMEPNDKLLIPPLNVHPEYFLPAGTKIFAVSDGTVTDVPTLYSNDYSILVSQEGAPDWTLNYEHVWNPLVKKGDKIKAGQPIAEVSTLQMESIDSRYGKWALMIFKNDQTTDGEDHLAYCPYLLFDESVKTEMQAKISPA